MFFTDLSLFYLLPLLLFVILHSLIAAVLLRPAPRILSDNRTNEDGDKQQRNQVSDVILQGPRNKSLVGWNVVNELSFA